MGCFNSSGWVFLGSNGPLFHASGIFGNGSGTLHYRFVRLGRRSCSGHACKEVLAAMRNLTANNSSGGAYGQADGCVDTPAGISHYASRFILSISYNTCDRDLLPPAPVENKRNRSILAQQLSEAVSKVRERLTALRDYSHLGKCELQFSTSCSHLARSTHFGEVAHRSVRLLFRILPLGCWIARCITLPQQNMLKWTRDIWSSTSLSGSCFSWSPCARGGSGRYA